MSDAWERYLKNKANMAEKCKDNILLINKGDIPQHILWEKSVSDKLGDEDAKCVKIEDKFYFTEALVNKLMYLSSLRASMDVNKDSFEKGWTACMQDVLNKLGVEEREEDGY